MKQTSLKLNSGRRRLLKLMIAAGGGIAASAFLPARWMKPVVRSGVLPAHAQTSQLFKIVGSRHTVDSQSGEVCATCLISPIATGIPLQLVITPWYLNGSVQKTVSLPEDPITVNSSDGTADFGCITVETQDLVSVDFDYSFANSSQCIPPGCTYKTTWYPD